MNNFIPLIGVILTGLLAILGYIVQKNKDRQIAILEKKRDVYSDFYLVFNQLNQGTPAQQEKARSRSLHVRSQLALYGSDEVVKAGDAFAAKILEEVHNPSGKEGFLTDAAAALLYEMRTDLMAKTSITIGDMENLMTT